MMWSLVERRAWAISLLALGVIAAFPQIEIALSAAFFEPERRLFLLRSHPLGEFTRKTLPVILFALAGLTAVAGALSRVKGRPILGIDLRAAVYVVGSLALGPGLIVNALLKDWWGRARPSTIAEFAGPLHYTAALVPSDQCADNCSFPSGHAALGFWVVSYAFLAPARWRRPAIWAATGFGAAVGLVRIAQGGHFLSDVIASGVIVISLCALLHRVIIVQSSMTIWKNIAADQAESR